MKYVSQAAVQREHPQIHSEQLHITLHPNENENLSTQKIDVDQSTSTQSKPLKKHE